MDVQLFLLTCFKRHIILIYDKNVNIYICGNPEMEMSFNCSNVGIKLFISILKASLKSVIVSSFQGLFLEGVLYKRQI